MHIEIPLVKGYSVVVNVLYKRLSRNNFDIFLVGFTGEEKLST